MLFRRTPNPTSLLPESSWLKSLRIVVGMALGIQAVIFFFIASFIGVMTLLLGSLAFLGGAGNATSQQIKVTGFVLLAMVICPFVWTMMLAVSSISILSRKRPWLIIIFCTLSIFSEIGLLLYMVSPERLQSSMTGEKLFVILTMFVPLAGVMITFVMKRGMAIAGR